MSCTPLNLIEFMHEVLASDLTGEEVFAIAHRVYGVSHKRFGQLWNELLCSSHGI